MKEHKIITYLEFGGNCEEAINAYIAAFGGQILYLSHWDENNCEDISQVGRVMHTEFQLGGTRMAAGDAFGAQSPRGMKLMIHMDTKDEAEYAVSILERGGEVINPLSPHPAPDDGGMGCVLRDRYGVLWIITCPNPDKQNVG